MAINLKGRSILTLMDLTPLEIRYLLDLSRDLKAQCRACGEGEALKGKHIVLLFEKTSTRIRCSFETAASQEGARVTYLDMSSRQMGKRESLEDFAKILGRYFDGIAYRGFTQKTAEDLSRYSGVPVWNALTDADHPMQILADMMTMEEHCGKPLCQIKVVFPGDVQSTMCYAWMYGCAKMGIHFVGLGPKELVKRMEPEILRKVQAVARENGASIEITDDESTLLGADVVCGSVWICMGEEAQVPERVRLLTPYRVTNALLERTGNPKVKYMHCLPSFHDFEADMAKEWKEKGVDIREVTDEVFRSPRSLVFDEAENRLHVVKAAMVAAIGR